MNSKPIPAPIIKTPTWNWRVAMATSIQLCEVSKHCLYFQREREREMSITKMSITNTNVQILACALRSVNVMFCGNRQKATQVLNFALALPQTRQTK